MKIVPIVFACLATQQIFAQSEPGSAFRVHVVDSITKSPVVGANVVLDNEHARQISGRTDGAGVFAGRSPAVGGHLLNVARKGYRMAGGAVMGTKIEIKAGAETDVTVEMMPLGVVVGRVVDQYGDPVRHAIVRTEDKMSLPGQDQYYESYASALTDDLGQYRVADVEPGKHYLAAEYSSTHEERVSGTRSRYRWPETGGLVLYPDATSIELAQQVDVAAGETKHLNDIHLKIQRAITISGRIKPAPSSKSPSLSLRRTLQLGLATSPMVQGGASEPDGTFKMEVLPGIYVLTASDAKTGKVSKPLTLDARDTSITNIELQLSFGYEIKGRITFDGTESTDLSKLMLNFGGPQVKVDPNGMFQANLTDGKGVYMLQGLPDGWYVKDVLVAGRRITTRQFEAEPGTSDLAFVLSPRGARVEVTLETKAGGLQPAIVLLLPESGAIPDVESTLHAEPNASGKFILPAVPPGSYRLFVLDASNWALVMRPDILLEKHRAVAPLINVAEGERKALVVPPLNIQPE